MFVSGCADPCSSLLTVGRVPVMNFIQNQSSNMDPVLSYPSRCNSFCYHSPDRKVSSISTLQLPVSLWITSRNTWGLPMQVLTLTEMLLVCCTHICYLPACIKLTCCICAAHKTHSFCMCAAYRIIETAPHVCHTQADEVCTCVQYVQHACSCSCAGSIHAAHEQLHTFCMHVFCTPCVLVCGMHVARFNFCVCSTHALYVQHVCCMYA